MVVAADGVPQRDQRGVLDDRQRRQQTVVAGLEEPGALDLEVAAPTDSQRPKQVARLIGESDCEHDGRESSSPRRSPSTGRIASVLPVLHCRDLEDASSTIAALYGVPPKELEQALPLAEHRATEDPGDPIRALPRALADALRQAPETPARIHYFHGTRAGKPQRFLREGLRPLGQVLDSLWKEVAALIPEVSHGELRSLRANLTAGRVGPHTYGVRVADDPLHHGPCGHLLREMFLHPHEYTSVDYLAGAEIVIDICQAVEQRTGIDATARYRAATKPCIVEFSVPARHFNDALAASLWYLAAGLRGEQTTNGNWSFCSDGKPLPAKAIVTVFDP